MHEIDILSSLVGLRPLYHVCPALKRWASAPASAHQQLGGSPDRRESWTSVAEGNCVVERRGGEQPEANNQSISKTMLNSIRPDTTASPLAKDEARDRKPTREGQGNFGSPRCYPASASQGVCRVIGDGMEGSWSDVKWGTRPGKGGEVHLRASERRVASGRRQSPRSSEEAG